MAIRCPYCQHAIGVKGAKPGRYGTKCPKCAKKFSLTIPADPDGLPTVAPLRDSAAVAGDGGATVPAPAATLAGTEAGPGDDAGGATGAWTATPPTKLSATLPESASARVPVADANVTGAWDPAATGAGPRPTAPGGGAAPTAAQGFSLTTAAGPVLSVEDTPHSEIPSVLGGYQILKELGRGGMGAVYLARQLSLDRNVAIKVMKPEWAQSPTFVSRFTREAYAAAQLTHHNVVQIYDFGQDRGTNFFSMEFVQGQTLSNLVRTEKKLAPEVAVGYILQAARGLKYAHDQSMIHRDIKPDNLLLNDQGVVKVADLGLVKTPAVAEVELARELETGTVAHPGTIPLASSAGQITLANVAMGTPAFMAPEQARDAANVDIRADIYSLGCTLYDLVTGRPPFEGKTAVELITKHQTEPIVPPEMLVKRVPRELSEIILKMVAKRPEDRYAHLGEVIKALEEFIGIATPGTFSPKEEHANLLTECVDAFHSAPMARLRPKLVLVAAAACVAVVLLSAMARQPLLAGGFLGLGLMTALATFLIQGLTEKTPLFLRARGFLYGNSLADWALIGTALLLFATLLLVTKLIWAWVAFGIVAVLIAVGRHVAVDRRVEAERRGAIEKAEGMLRSMRLHGLDEELLRQFVCRYSGDHWEEFYETLFGYDAKIVARDRWGRGDRGKPRKTFGAWRDPVIRWIDAKQQQRREAREKRLLQKLEEKSLEAQGVNLVTARRRAQRSAEAMVTMAAELKATAKLPAALRPEKKAIGVVLREAAAKPEDVLVDREQGLYGPKRRGRLEIVLGPRPRFLLGAVLLTTCLVWLHQNNLLTQEKLQAAAETAQTVGSQVGKDLTKAVTSKNLGDLRKEVPSQLVTTVEGTRPLRLPGLPKAMAAQLFNSFNPGLAGLILILSSLFQGARMSVFAIPAALIAFAGPAFGVPLLGRGTSAALGLLVGAAGVVLGRERR